MDLMDTQFWTWLSRLTGATAAQGLAADHSDADVRIVGVSDAAETTEDRLALEREAEISADAARLAQDILKLDRALFGLESQVHQGPLQEALEAALENAPYERVLLALCHDHDIEEVMDAVETMPNHPIEANEEGFAEITAALLALCANVARSRGILLAAETVDGSKIASMVRGHWKGPPYAPSSRAIPEMVERFGRAFVTADDTRLRGLLNLPASTIGSNVNPGRANRIAGEPPGDDAPDGFGAVAAHWRSAWAEAQKTLGMLREAVDTWVGRETCPSVEITGGTWAKVTAIFDAVSEHPLGEEISAIDRKAGEEKIRSIARISTNIENKLELVRSDRDLSLLDASPLLKGQKPFRTIFEGALVEMHKLMVLQVNG
jgi:hypothetical protein